MLIFQCQVLINNIADSYNNLEDCGSLSRAFCQQYKNLPQILKSGKDYGLFMETKLKEDITIIHTRINQYNSDDDYEVTNKFL